MRPSGRWRWWRSWTLVYKRNHVLHPKHFPEHRAAHLATVARLHAANAYDRLTGDFETITGRSANAVREFVASHADSFRRRAASSPSSSRRAVSWSRACCTG